MLSSKRREQLKRLRRRKTVRRPKRTSADGLEQAQAKQSTANKVGKVKKTKVVNAVDGGEPSLLNLVKRFKSSNRRFERRLQMKLTLLPGESVRGSYGSAPLCSAGARATGGRGVDCLWSNPMLSHPLLV
jgi:hypothetical protein